MAELKVQGLCRVCGHKVKAVLAGPATSRAEGRCPQCQTREFYVDFAQAESEQSDKKKRK